MSAEFKAIGKRIRTQRHLKKMTQAYLAECVGVSNVFISNIETGRKNASLEVLLRIAAEFSLSLDYLVFNRSPAQKRDAYHAITELLADCDMDELERIKIIVADYKKMIRYKK